MRNVRNCGAALLLMALMAGACLADQPAPPAKFYKLDFVVKEVESGKVVNTRTYSTMVSSHDTSRACSIRTGGRIPYNTGKEYMYLDVGVNIDCLHVNEAQNGLSLWIDADISSVVQESTTNTDRPFLRQNKWGSTVLVPLKKPTVVFSSDDLNGKHQTQLELTATPIS